MSLRRRIRLSAALSGIAVIGALLVPSAPAFADDTPTPTPTPVVEPVETETPTLTPAPEPVETQTPTPTPATTATFTGAFEDLSADGDVTPLPKGVRLFHASGTGYLLVSGAPLGSSLMTITVEVPAGVDDDASALVDYSVQQHPLALVSAKLAKQTAQMVNQTPNTSATHQVYAVLVTPSNMANTGVAANQTAAKVATAVAHADDLWSQQSGGTVRFSLAGTTSWYYGSATCATSAGSTALWNQAATVAATQLGYTDAPNTHLVLFFPSDADCGGALGLGSVGYSTNAGGHAWVIGTDAPIELATSAHELGHNLSLGHADWLQCASATPSPGFLGTDGCVVQNYGDLTDIMGFGQDGISGGALSSPQAIRSNIWPASAYAFAPKGTASYTLKPVSGNAGLRSVVVEDNQGVSYFVEFRNYTGEDDRPGVSPAGAYCASASPATPACITDRPGVRILRLSQDDALKGSPGNDSYLIGRTVNGADRIDYLANESFSNHGITIKVTSVSASSATVSVTRNFQAGVLGDVGFYPGVVWDYDALRVGDTWGLVMSSDFVADSEKFQWYRNGTAIPGATRQFYTITNADYDKSITVRITVSSKGYQSATGVLYPEDYGVGDGWVRQAYYGGNAQVSVAQGTAPLKASLKNFPWGSTFAYQWYRDAAKISGATSSTYTPVAADAGHQVKVVVTPTSAGNVIAPVESPAFDYRLDTDGSVFGISGTAKVANVLSAPIVGYQSTAPAPVSVTRAFQWYRSGVAIAGATGATYTLVGADAGKALTVKVTASAPGYVLSVITTSPTATVAPGTIQGSHVGPDLTKTGTTTTTVKLTAALPSGSITEPGVAYKYQWYRSVPAGTPELPIAGATAASYTLTTADYNKLVWVTITATKPGYTTEPLGSARLNYSVTASDTPVISGTARVGEYLSVNTLTWGPTAPASSPTYTWYANGVAVQTGTQDYYQVQAADYTKKITVRVTAANPGYLSLVLTSPATAAVVKGVFAGALSASVLQNGRTLTAVPAGLAPTSTYAYQWLRNGAAIAGATKSTYALTAADYGKLISVKLTSVRLNFVNPPAFTTEPTSYSILALTAPAITGEVRKGAELSVQLPIYTVDGIDTAPSSTTYQWLRAGVAISGETHATYTPGTADLGKPISVRVTSSYVSGSRDLLPAIQTSSSTQPIGTNSLAGWNASGSVVVDHTGLVLTVPADGTGITEPGVTKAYQWYRNGVAVVGATKATYTLTSADASKTVYVRVVTSKPTYTTVVKLSPPVNYTVTQSQSPYLELFGNGGRVGTMMQVETGTYSAGGVPASVDLKYTWYRNGVAIPELTSTTTNWYSPGPSDLGKKITARVVSSAGSEWLPLSSTTAAATVAQGIIVAQDEAPSVVNETTPTSLKSTASYTGVVTTPDVTVKYQWYRDGVAIAGATSAVYTRTYLDNGKATSVSAVLSSPGFATRTLTASNPETSAYLVGTGAVTINDTTPVRGQTLKAVSTYTFTNDDGAAVTPTLTYQWYLNGAAVAGATASTFKVPTTALNKSVSVRLVASSSSYVPFGKVSSATGKVK